MSEQQHKQIFSIEGMDCSSCALTIEKHMKNLPSVKRVSVHFSTGKMNVEHDDSTEEIIKEDPNLVIKLHWFQTEDIMLKLKKTSQEQT